MCCCIKGVAANELLTLNALEDGGDPENTRPPYTTATIIAYAIWGSPKERLTTPELEIALKRRFRYFAIPEHNSRTEVRHIFFFCKIQFPSNTRFQVSLLLFLLFNIHVQFAHVLTLSNSIAQYPRRSQEPHAVHPGASVPYCYVCPSNAPHFLAHRMDAGGS